MTMDAHRERARKNLRTAIILGLIAVSSLGIFIYQVWQLG
jgi:hypothetical protein